MKRWWTRSLSSGSMLRMMAFKYFSTCSVGVVKRETEVKDISIVVFWLISTLSCLPVFFIRDTPEEKQTCELVLCRDTSQSPVFNVFTAVLKPQKGVKFFYTKL